MRKKQYTYPYITCYYVAPMTVICGSGHDTEIIPGGTEPEPGGDDGPIWGESKGNDSGYWDDDSDW